MDELLKVDRHVPDFQLQLRAIFLKLVLPQKQCLLFLQVILIVQAQLLVKRKHLLVLVILIFFLIQIFLTDYLIIMILFGTVVLYVNIDLFSQGLFYILPRLHFTFHSSRDIFF